MIKFFRNIRKKVITGNRVGKPTSPEGRYLLYAVGEIFLVVIGILIALQINNWNQNQQDRKEEQKILASISDEMSSMKWQSVRGLNTYQAILNSSKRLLVAINNPELEFPDDSVNHHLAILMARWIFGKSNNTNIYDALTGSGDLRFIQSRELRRNLTHLDKQILLLSVYEDIYFQFVENDLIPYLNTETDGIEISVNRDAFINERFGFNPSEAQLPLNRGRFPTYSDRILNSQKLSNLLVYHIRNTSGLIPIYLRLQDIIVQVDSLQIVASQGFKKQ